MEQEIAERMERLMSERVIQHRAHLHAASGRRDERRGIGSGGKSWRVASGASHLREQSPTTERRGILRHRRRRRERAHEVREAIDVGAAVSAGGIFYAGILERQSIILHAGR